MAITWGSISGNGRIGIEVVKTTSNTSVSVSLKIYVWTKYSCSDSTNNLYVNGSNKGSVTISTSHNSGSGWDASNQEYVYTYNMGSYDRGTSDKSVNCSASISGVEYIGATPSVSTSFTVPALASYTVSYNANGGSNPPSSQTKWYGTALTLSSTKPTRSGYKFTGWNTASNGTGTNYASGASYTGNAAVTLYAIWEEYALTVNYYSNYATSAFDGALNEVGADKNILVRTANFYYDNAYSDGLHNYSATTNGTYLGKTGYTATGNWGTSTSGGTLVNENTGFTTGQAMAQAFGKSLSSGNASVNIYAQWTPNIYTVTYDGNGGLYNGSTTWSENATYDSNYTTQDNFFKREGYKFIGWNEKADGTGTDWTSYIGNPWKWTYTRNVTLYAIWEESGIVYIDNSTALEPYLIYIDNGTTWDMYLPYVDNGSGWNIIS